MNSLLNVAGNALLPAAEKLAAGDVIAITFTGLSVVFIGLIILIVFLTIMSKIFTRKKPAPKQELPPAPPTPTPTPKPADTSAEDDTEVVAAITAAIAAMGEADGTTYAIREIRKRPAAVGRPAWAMAGIRDNTMPF